MLQIQMEIPLLYTISGTDAGDFLINISGVVSFASTPDYENPADNGGNNVYNFYRSS